MTPAWEQHPPPPQITRPLKGSSEWTHRSYQESQDTTVVAKTVLFLSLFDNKENARGFNGIFFNKSDLWARFLDLLFKIDLKK